MKVNISISLILGLIIMTGCSTKQTTTYSPYEILPTASVQAITEVQSKPLLFSWRMPEGTSMTMGDFNLGVFGMQLSARKTTIFYALSGLNASEFVDIYAAEVTDPLGRSYALQWIQPLTQVDQIELGMMVFSPRIRNAGELYLQLTPKDGTSPQQMLVAEFLGPPQFHGTPEEDRSTAIYSLRRDNKFELSGYTIDFGFVAPSLPPFIEISPEPIETETPPAGPLPTPSKIEYNPWLEVPAGVQVRDEFSFHIVKADEQLDKYLGIQLLSDGSVIVMQESGTAEMVIPIVITPTPQGMYPTP